MHNDTEVLFNVQDYGEAFWDDCIVLIVSERTRDIAVSAIRYAEYFNTRWRNNDGFELTPEQRADARRFYEMALGELIMSCDIQDDIKRIADSLESLDAKAAQFYSWQDVIDDLEEAFGVSHLLYKLADGIIGLFPRFRIKVDMSWLPKSIWEYMMWRSPILTMLGAITASQGVQAAAAATGKVLSVIDTAMAALGILQTTALGWKDIIFGDKSLWEDLIKPLWALFIADEDGGEGGADPDIDPTIRVYTRIVLTEEGWTLNVNPVNNINVPEGAFQIDVTCKDCGGVSGLCGCPDIDGPVNPIDTIAYDPCQNPDPDFGDYICGGANWLGDKLADVGIGLGNSFAAGGNLINSALSDPPFSIQVAYTTMAQQLAANLPGQFWLNLPNEQRGTLITILVDRLASAAENAVLLGVPETAKTFDVIQDYSSAFINMAAWMLDSDNRDPFVQGVFDEVANGGDTGTLLSVVQDFIDDARVANGGHTEVQEAALAFINTLSEGLMGVFSGGVPEIANYASSYDCGNLSCCREFWVNSGTAQGGDTYEAVPVGGYYEIEVWLNCDQYGLPCGTTLALNLSNITGFTSLPGNASVKIDDNETCDVPGDCGEMCGNVFLLRSTTAWQADIYYTGCV